MFEAPRGATGLNTPGNTIDVGLVVGFPEITRRRWRKRLANRALRRPFSVISALLSLIFLAEGDRALPAEVTEAP